MTTPDSIDEQVRAHFAAQRPSTASMQKLRALADPKQATRRLGWIKPVAVAASVMLAFVVGWLASPGGGDVFTASVHEEIALNHRKELGSEWPTSDLAELRVAMDKLPFRLELPSEYPNFRLRGGRYCSIDGQLAAQLQLVDGDVPCTLYVLADDPALASVGASTRQIEGIKVTTWREGGLLFGMARVE